MLRTGRVLLVVALFGCSAEPPDDSLPGNIDASDIDPDAGVPKARISVDPLPATTPWGLYPVTGRGPEGGTLLLTSSAGGTKSVDIATDGTFCLDVELAPGKNTLSIEAIDASGAYTDKIDIQVSREGEPPLAGEPETRIEWENVARDATVTYSMTVTAGVAGDMIDGNTTSFATLQGITGTDYVNFKLPELRHIERIRILSSDECTLEAFKLRLSQLDEPTIPSTFAPDWGQNWGRVAVVQGTGTNEYEWRSSAGPLPAKNFNLEVVSSWQDGNFDCSYTSAVVQIIEIEIWSSKEVTAPATSEAPNCRSAASF